MRKLDDPLLQERLNYAYLEIGDVTKMKIVNKLLDPKFEDSDKFIEHLIQFMRNPKNFWFTCKYLLNIDLLPYQLTILQKMWVKPFPMLIASRGAAKCITKDSICITNKGLLDITEIIGPTPRSMERIYLNDNAYGENGFNKIEYGWYNGKTKNTKITTNFGFSLEGTGDHPVRILKDGKIEWSHLEDIKIGDYTIILRDKIDLPNNHPEITEDIAWWLGATTGDGQVSDPHSINFTNTDPDIINKWISVGKKILNKEHCGKTGITYRFSTVQGSKLVNEHFELNYKKSHDKAIPRKIRESGSKNIAAFLRGLFDTDGCVTNRGAVEYCSVSEKMIDQVHSALLTFGIISKKRSFYSSCNGKKFLAYKITITNINNIKLYDKYIGFDCGYKNIKLKNVLNKKSNPNKDIIPKQLITDKLLSLVKQARDRGFIASNTHSYSYVRGLLSSYRINKYEISYDTLNKILNILSEHSDIKEYQQCKDIYNKNYYYDRVVKIEESENDTYDVHIPNDHSFVSNGFISHNTTLLTIYAALRMILDQGITIVVVGAAFRQSLILFENLKTIYDNSPVLQDICGGGKKGMPKKELHMASWQCGSSKIKFLPIGNGETIRGQRAQIVLADEFSSIDPLVFELVVKGFAAVNAKGVVENVRHAYKIKLMEEMGYQTHDPAVLGNRTSRIQTNTSLGVNQVILAGTASYQFNHFYRYYKMYKDIIMSGGDFGQMKSDSPGLVMGDGIRSEDYCVIRLPVDLLPDNMMDKGVLAQSKAMMNQSLYFQEYGCVFPSDSDGFYPASILHKATCPIKTMDGDVLDFKVSLSLKSSNVECVMGIDPASEKDNFAINIIQYEPVRKIIYQWSTNRKKFQDLKENGKIPADINDYNTYCIKHIRQLLRNFSIVLIVMDAGGGGTSVREGLKDPSKLEDGDQLIYDMDDEQMANQPGSHMLKMINFADYEFRRGAHHGLLHDFENLKLLFPKFDTLVLASGTYNPDGESELEDAYLEIEELKAETTLVKREVTQLGQERWVVPELKVSGSDELTKKLKKDRFSSLLLANWGCRMIDEERFGTINYTGVSGVAKRGKNTSLDKPMYRGSGMKKAKMGKSGLFGSSINRH